MIFSDYVAKVNKMLADNPELGKCNVIYSSDEEGNSFSGVYFSPTPGYLTDDECFYTKGEQVEEGDFVINSICIN